jgi:hypothetical protein
MKVTCFRAILIHFTTRNTIIVYSVLKFKDTIANRIAVGRVICMDPALKIIRLYRMYPFSFKNGAVTT